MKLIVESGATKANWVLIDSKRVLKELETKGIRPNAMSENQLNSILCEAAKFFEKDEIQTIHFFGSGCLKQVSSDLIKGKLINYFADVSFIEVKSDLVAAGLVAYQKQTGAVGIMGTGSVAFEWKNQEVNQLFGGLGYLEGDEGGGSDLGKRLLNYLINVEENDDLLNAFHQKYGSPKSYYEKAMQAENPASELAKLTYFIKENRTNLKIKNIISTSFKRYLKTLEPLREMYHEIVLIGSIAYYFQPEIRQIFSENGWKIKRIIHRPINELVEIF